VVRGEFSREKGRYGVKEKVVKFKFEYYLNPNTNLSADLKALFLKELGSDDVSFESS